MPDRLFSLKMRASQEGSHISGAEKILPKEALPANMELLLERAMHHSKGEPDSIRFKVDAVADGDIVRLDALPVTNAMDDSRDAAYLRMKRLLLESGVARADEIISILRNVKGMRGAVLLDADTLERLEPDHERGVRATLMDAEGGNAARSAEKNHFAEAIVLATKVANAPGIVAELCVSDDPYYVIGYIASKSLGYVRLSPLKQKGSPDGGRIFLYRGPREKVVETIGFLERTPVLVRLPETKARGDCRSRVSEVLKMLKDKSLLRTETVYGSAPAPSVMRDGGRCLMFASNDYLDLANEASVKTAAAEAVMRYGAGTGGSRLTTGTFTIHKQLESALAEFKGTEDAVLFNTGFAANSGVVPALCGPGDVVFSDELNHASIIDGCRMSRARIVVYRHNDMDDLEAKVAEHGNACGMVVSDAVFSMDGDILDLPRFMEIAARHNLLTMVDEAHSTGVIGGRGHGILEHFGMEGHAPDILMGTLSKSLGSEGGYVCCSSEMALFLRNRTRSYIFSTAMPASSAAAALAALEFLKAHPERVDMLRGNVRFLLDELEKAGIDARTESAIVPVILGESERALRVAARMLARGIVVSPIRYPSVAENAARLRMTVMATHSREELAACASALAESIKSV